MKKVYIVLDFAFDTKEEARAFAIPLISGSRIGSKWNSDSWHYSSTEYLSENELSVSIKEKVICETEAEAQEKTDIEIMKKKMWIFEKKQTEDLQTFDNIPF